jgi:predicted nucleic acid-binding protein
LIVVDASVLVNALADDEDAGDAARVRLLGDADLHAPHVVDLEVLSVLRRAVGARRLDARRAQLALDDLHDLRLTRYAHAPFAQRIWELRQDLTPYDAAYVALAEELDCPFLTADERLARSPQLPCAIEVLR